MITTFAAHKPTTVSHARALTLKAMGDQVIDETKESLSELDNNPEYDLNPQDGLVIVSAGKSDSVADISVKYDTDSQDVESLSLIQAPGSDALTFDSFSFHKTSGKSHYRFEINGKVETLDYNPKTDTITTQY